MFTHIILSQSVSYFQLRSCHKSWLSYWKISPSLSNCHLYIFRSWYWQLHGNILILKYFLLPWVGFQLLAIPEIDIANNHPISGYWKTIVRVCQVSKYLLQSTPTTNSFSVTVCLQTYQHTVVFLLTNVSVNQKNIKIT